MSEETRKSVEALALLLTPRGEGRVELGSFRREREGVIQHRWEVEVDDVHVLAGDWDEDLDDALDDLSHKLISKFRHRQAKLDRMLGVPSDRAEAAEVERDAAVLETQRYAALMRFLAEAVRDGHPDAGAIAREHLDGTVLSSHRSTLRDGTLYVGGWALRLVASEIFRNLDAVGAVNNCEWTMTFEGRAATLSAQWKHGLTPSQQRDAANARAQAAEKENATLRKHLAAVLPYEQGHGHNETGIWDKSNGPPDGDGSGTTTCRKGCGCKAAHHG